MTFLAPLLLASVVHGAFNPTRFPPSASYNISYVINGTKEAPGIYNSSTTPDELYGIYNWCAMPHVRETEYGLPSSKYELKYVEVIQRHHKRTPYASNTFFKEDVNISCSGAGPVYYVKSDTGPDVSVIQWSAYTSSANPWANSVGPGFENSGCQLPQISTEGLWDSYQHGVDLRNVYAPLLNLPEAFDPSIARIRVTNNEITSQVAGGLVKGLFPASSGIEVLVEPSSIDSLEPSLKCSNRVKPGADDDGEGDGGIWTGHLEAASALYEKLDSVSGIDPKDNAGWHTSLDHYYDNLSFKQCHGLPLPCSLNDTSLCVTQEEANTVYRLGNWEYAYYYRDSNISTVYSAMQFGAWFLELAANVQGVINGSNSIKYLHNVAHDGSISALLGFLQIDEMVWPGMGSEVVFELYEQAGGNQWFIRILFGGQPLVTSTPLGTLDMVPIQDFLDYITQMVGSGEDLYNACNSS